MMTKKVIRTMLLLVAGLLAVSCNMNRGNVDVAKSLEIDSVRVEHRDSVGEFSIRADFAEGSDAVLANAINEYIMETLGGEYEGDFLNQKAMLDFCLAKKVGEYHDFYGEANDGNRIEGITYLYNASIKKGVETPKFVTYYYTCEEFMGGAHGSYLFYGQTFRKIDGRRFTWDIVSNTESEEFQQLIKDGLKSYWEVKTDEELKEYLFDQNGFSLPLPKCPPLFGEAGVEFVYQQYEIAPYAAGLPSFVVSYEKLKPFMNITARRLSE